MCKGLNDSDSSITVSLDVVNYPPGAYTIIFNVTDVYGQTAVEGIVGILLLCMLLLMLVITSTLLQIICLYSVHYSTNNNWQV